MASSTTTTKGARRSMTWQSGRRSTKSNTTGRPEHLDEGVDSTVRHLAGKVDKAHRAGDLPGEARAFLVGTGLVQGGGLSRPDGQPRLRKGWGKKVFELQPRIDWHKGKAVRWLLDALGLNTPGVLPLYIGDDVTDEDAFRALAESGITIAVAETPRRSAARSVVQDTAQVQVFLQGLAAALSA